MTGITPGSLIGPYEITREIGRGGMGVVYLAHDAKLDRDVAIKCLPDELSEDADRMTRLEREAKLLASLNHPNIATIHGLEEVDDKRYLILEYIEGDTLEERLRKGAIPVDESLPIAIQIAEAIEAAHEKGVIHRDLKPANIKFTSDDKVKVLDFGLAKALVDESSTESELANSPTIIAGGSPTLPGVLLGTAGYLSPEQARGRPVDKRTDIFAFGCLLYEMLTGAGSFIGETVTDSIAATIHKEPEWERLPANTPPLIVHLLKRCLEKNRHNRLHDIADARLEIEAAIADPTSSSFYFATGELHSLSSSRRWIGAMMIILAAAVIGTGLLIRNALQPARGPTITRFTIDLPSGAKLAINEYGKADVAVSGDGRTIAYFVIQEDNERALHVRDLDSFSSRVLPDTAKGHHPFFSPDGLWIAYHSDNRLMKIPLDSGSPITICQTENAWAGAWLDDDTIVYIGGEIKLMQVSANGGVPKPFASIVEDAHLGGALSTTAVPGSRSVLVTGWHSTSIEGYDIVAISLDTGRATTVVENAANPLILESGHLIFQRVSSLYGAVFDPVHLTVTGPHMPVLHGVATTAWADDANAFVSPSGTLVFIPGERHGPGRQLAWVDREGNIELVSQRTDAFVWNLRFSPGGTKFTVGTLRHEPETWVYEPVSDLMTLLPYREGGAGGIAWSPDGQRIAGYVYDSVTGLPDALMIHSLSNLYEPQTFLKKHEWKPQDWTRDGSQLLLMGVAGEEANDDSRKRGLAVWNTDGSQPPELVIGGLDYNAQARLSRDGEWVVFEKIISGTNHIFVRRFPVTGEEWQVSVDGGSTPAWSQTDDEIYFYHNLAMMAAKVSTENDFSVEPAKKLFDAPWAFQNDQYDVAPDGRFIVIQLADWELEPVKLHVVLNWDEEVRKQFTK